MSSCWSATDVAADDVVIVAVIISPVDTVLTTFFVCLLAQQLEMLWDSFYVIFEMGKL